MDVEQHEDGTLRVSLGAEDAMALETSHDRVLTMVKTRKPSTVHIRLRSNGRLTQLASRLDRSLDEEGVRVLWGV